MTKAQLLSALAALPDSAHVYCAVVPHSKRMDLVIETMTTEMGGFGCADTTDVTVYDEDGPSGPAFACIEWTYY